GIDPDLAQLVAPATPHIAGHSLDAKAAGTQMLFNAVKRFLGSAVPLWDPTSALPPPTLPILELSTAGRYDEELLAEAVRAVYDIEADDARLREVLRGDAGQRATGFDALRENYHARREFPLTRVRLVHPRPSARALLDAAGFGVDPS